MQIFIYGTGSGAIKFLNSLNMDKVKIIGFLDSDENKEGIIFLNYKVFHPKTIKNMDYDFILIASEYIEIYFYLMSLGFDERKIIPIYKMETIVKEYLDKYEILQNICSDFLPRYILTKKMEYGRNNGLEKYYLEHYDYTRYKTLKLVAEEIKSRNICGEVAEVGVYRGDFAKVINICFNDRKLYLFDTFEGFNEEERDYELKNRFTSNSFFEKCDFKNTSIMVVLNKMLYKDNCIIKSGYFPDTAVGINGKFAFVSIDVDLFKPTYNALEFFYPKLTEGGYIFLHDYNNREFFGVKKAVKDFENKYGRFKKFPISDWGGTLVISK